MQAGGWVKTATMTAGTAMIMRARSGKQHHSNKMHVGRQALRPAPLSAALALALAAGGAVLPESAAASGAWFAQSGSGKAQAANGAFRPAAGMPGRTAAQQQQQSRQQLQRSLDNLGRTASAIASQQAAQSAARAAAQNDPSVPDGYQAGGLWDNDALGNALAWSGAERARQTTGDGKTTVAIKQTSDKAILNWDTFNVGRQTTVNFEQQSDWSVLNRVNDPQQRPSQIQGQVRGDGTVMVVNRNGIVFSGSSQVNVRNLVAAAVDISDQQFAKGIYSDVAGDAPGSRTYLPSFGNDLTSNGSSSNATGDVMVQAGAQIATRTPSSATRGGGYVLMLGREVSNAGTIDTPNGQALLAAGDSFVIRRGYNTQENPLSTTRGNEVAPRINASSTAGSIGNSGLMLARTGDITLTGRNIVQQGVAVATTDVNARGTVHLLNSATDTAGSVTLAPGNITAVLVDENAATAFDAQWDALSESSAIVNRYEANAGMAFDNLSRIGDQANLSRIEVVSGGTVDFQEGSLTLATGGQITVSAGLRSLVRTGADLDVAGAVGVRVAMEANNIQVNVQGNEQRDAPVNRDSGTLNNLDVWVDRRQLVFVPAGTNGYATDRWYTKGGLLEVSGYVGTVGHTAGEWLAQGGSVTFGGNDVVTQRGSRINLSGGTLDVQSGNINMTWLRGSDGRLYELSSAPGDMLYTGYYRGFESLHERWGDEATRRFYNPLIAPASRYERGYTVGRDAGRLLISTPSAVLEGSVIGDVFDGDRQHQAPQGALGGYKQSQTALARSAQLILAQYNPNRAPGTLLDDADFTEMANHVLIGDVAQDIASGLGLGDAVPADRQGTIRLDHTALNQSGLGSIVVGAKETVGIEGALQVASGGEIIVRAPQIRVGANLVAHGGSISLGDLDQKSPGSPNEAPRVTPADPQTIVGVTVAPGVKLDASGLWSNLLLDPSDRRSLAYVNGGEVSIRSSAAVTLGEASVIDVSSGAAIKADGSLVGGKGGNVTLSGSGNLMLGGDIRGYGVSGGGTLTIDAGTPVGLGGEILNQAGILQAGEIAPSDVKVLEDFVIAAGAILPADITISKSRALPGTMMEGQPSIISGVDAPVAIAADWSLPLATSGTYQVFYTYHGTSTSAVASVFSGAVVPAGAVITHLSTNGFPTAWIVDANVFPNGVPIRPTNVVVRAGQPAPQETRFAAGTVIKAGSALPVTVAVESTLVLAPDLLSTGFGSYRFTSTRGIVVPDGANLSVTVPVLRAAEGSRNVPTGESTSLSLERWTPPVFLPNPVLGSYDQRAGASLTLQAYGGNIAMRDGASIEVDPGHAISLVAGDKDQARIAVGGTLRAPGGSIRLGAPAELANADIETVYAGGARNSIRIGANAVLDVAGIALTSTDTRGRTYGKLYSGGDISLDAGEVPDTFVVVEQGATLNASGAEMSITRPGALDVRELIAVGSDGGSLSFASRAGLYLGGSMTARAGSDSAAGGTLALTLEGVLYDAARPIGNDIRKPAEITLVQNSGVGAAFGVPTADAALGYGQARIGVDQIREGGFDNVALYARDLITFDGDVDLKARQSIRLYQGSIGNTMEGANVSLTAPYVLLSGRTSLAPVGTTPVVDVTLNAWNPSQEAPAGSFSVNADLIDLRNAVRIGHSADILLSGNRQRIDRRGYAEVALNSRGDVRFLGAEDGVGVSWARLNSITGYSGLISSGDVTMEAARIYPTTHAYALVVAGILDANSYAPDGKLRISGLNASNAVPMSVFGQIDLRATTIVQGGSLYAPLGSISLGDVQSTQNVHLLAGSVTSSSAAGLVIPYGGTLDGLTYSYNGDPISATGIGGLKSGGGAGTAVLQGVSFSSASVTADAGALIDLSGGGQLTGAAFVSGRGGSTDPLYNALVRYDAGTGRFTLPSQEDHPVYAIVPGLQGSYAPVTPQDQSGDYAGSLPAMGQQITLGTGVPGLPAGTYTLLPSFYALLPGAYRVELSAAQSLSNGASAIALRNGSWSVPVVTGIAHTGVQSVLPSAAIVTSGDVLRKYGQYNETGYRDFIVSTAARTGTPRPMLPEDAKAFELRLPAGAGSTQPALDFHGTVDFSPARGGYGGQAIIMGRADPIASVALEIIGDTPTPGFAGASVRAEDINALGAARISIGGWLYGYGYPVAENDPDVRLKAYSQTRDVYLRDGAALRAPEVQLLVASSQRIHVEQGASINTLGQGAAPYDSSHGYQYAPGIAANMLVVSNGWVDVPGGVGAGSGGIEIGACASVNCTGNAELYSDGSIVFGSNNAVIRDTARFGTRNLTMAVSGLNIGTEAALAAAADRDALPAGLQLPQSLLSRLLNGDPERRAPALERLIFSVQNSVNLFGSASLSTADASGRSTLNQLVFNTPAMYGYGNQGDVATIATGTLVWNGAAGPVTAPVLEGGPGTGLGRLNLQADRILLGYANGTTPSGSEQRSRLTLGFSAVDFNASDRITANGQGNLAVYQSLGDVVGGVQQYTGGRLSLNTPLLTGEAGSVNRIETGGDLLLALPDGAAAGTTDVLGGSLSLKAMRVMLDSSVVLPSGKLEVTADGDVVLGAHARVDVAGRAVGIGDQVRYSWGGDVNLESAHGNVESAAGSLVDLSAQHNQTGTLTVTALDAAAGRIALQGNVSGVASGQRNVGGTVVPFDGGGIVLAGQTIDDLAGLNARLTAGGVTGLRAFRVKQGDLVLGSEIRAREVVVSVDGGSLTVDGTIDASGVQVGSIRLSARDNLTLTGNAVLDAHGTGLRVDSYGKIIDASNRAIVDLSSGTDGSGTLTLQAGATIDLRAGTEVALGNAAGQNDGRARGTLVLNVPRRGSTAPSATGAQAPVNATGADLDIAATGPVAVRGASSIAVYGYASYANAPADSAKPGTQIVDQAFLDNIDADSRAFMSGAYGNDVAAGVLTPGLQAKLAGLTAYGSAFHLRPGVEIRSATEDGNLVVSGDLDLSGYRYGPQATSVRGSGEPGALSLRAGGDLDIKGSINDGFAAPPATPDDYGWLVNEEILLGDQPSGDTERTWLPPVDPNLGMNAYFFPATDPLSWETSDPPVVLAGYIRDESADILGGSGYYGPGDTIAFGLLIGNITIGPGTVLSAANPANANIALAGSNTEPRSVWAVAPMLPAGSLSWDIRLGAGADLAAADRRALRTAAQLNGSGNLALSDTHVHAGTQRPIFSVVRTGTGDLDILAGGSFRQDSLYGIYTAGTQSAPVLGADGTPVKDAQGRDAYNLPRGYIDPASVLGAGSQYEYLVSGENYSAWYPENGGNVSVVVRGDLSGDILGASRNALDPFLTYAPSNYVGSWLWRQGGNEVGQSTAWWINFGTYVPQQQLHTDAGIEGFTGLGTLGGGNLDVRVGGNAGVLNPLGASTTRQSDGLNLAVGSTGRMVNGELILTGGGDMRLDIGGSLNPGVTASVSGNNPYRSVVSDLSGVMTNLRGSLEVSAGNIGRVTPRYGMVDTSDPRAIDALRPSLAVPAGGPVLVVGDAAASLSARGDVVLDGVSDAGRLAARNSLVFDDKLGGGTSWYTLWTGNTAIDLFSAGGNVTPISAQHYAASAQEGLLGNDSLVVAATYPAQFSAVAASGSIYYSPRIGSSLGNTDAQLVFAPSPTGQSRLELLAADSVYGAGFPLYPSSVASGSLATPARPAFIGRSMDTSAPATLVNNTTGDMDNVLVAFGPNTAEGSLYRNDPEPVRVYAGAGDLVGVSLGRWIEEIGTAYGSKAVRMQAGRDIVNSGGFFLNNNPTDISMVSAGRDIFYANIDVGGPGMLEVNAGRSIYQADQGRLSSIGLINGADDRSGGAGIAVTVGTGSHAVDYTGFAMQYLDPANLADPARSLADQPGKVVRVYGDELTLAQWLRDNYQYAGPDDEVSAQAFMQATQARLDAAHAADPSAARRDVQRDYQQASQLHLVNWLRSRFGYDGSTDALAYFQALPAEQQRVYARNLYYGELRAAGREYNDADGPRFNSYLRGRNAIARLFPTQDANGQPVTYQGDLTLFQGTANNGSIITVAGGDIQVLVPGGNLTIGVEGVPPATGGQAKPAGLITQGSGNIQLYTYDSILLGLSRIMTTYGGDISAWAAHGDINAGRGAKTTVVYTPLLRTYDDVGNVTQSPSVPATGAGVSVQNPIPEVPPGDIDLIAPEGIIDAGEAGIRASGNVNVAALQVVNAANIRAQGDTTGVPVVAAVNVGALTAASSAATNAVASAQDMVRAGQNAARQNLPSIISVQILGFGSDGGAPSGAESRRPPTPPVGPQTRARPAYDASLPMQVVGLGGNVDARALTVQEQRLLKQDQ